LKPVPVIVKVGVALGTPGRAKFTVVWGVIVTPAGNGTIKLVDGSAGLATATPFG